jgi:hypothetical protein
MKSIALLAAAVSVSAVLLPRTADACGGCFAPPKQVTTVTGHRMAFAVSQQQTVLWDQIQYSGAPQDFAWILPVTAGAKVELAHDAFFEALDAVTNPVITGPSANCGTSGVGCGKSSASASAYEGAGGGGEVQVLSQGVVGPYDTVTLQSSDPNALYAWLTVNGYDIPDATRPIIDAYVQGGFDFIALRLAPGQGVQAMQPVRVVTPGAGLTLPLRMVAAGVGANVGVTLYVIGEGRYEAQNFPNGVVDATKLTWSGAQSQSNYTTLAAQIMQASGGTWLTEYAGPQLMTLQTDPSQGSCYSQGGGVSSVYGTPTVSAAYYCQCVNDHCAPGGLPGDASADDASPGDASPGDASPEAAGPGCSATSCSTFDDLTVALDGMSPSTTWVTRLRTTLPASSLSQDLVLQASAGQTQVSNQLTASVYDDPSYSACGQTGGGGCSAIGDDSGTLGRGLVVASLAMVGAALNRRRARRKRS